MKNGKKRIGLVLFVLILLLGAFVVGRYSMTIPDPVLPEESFEVSENHTPVSPPVLEVVPDSPALTLVKEMKVGWNLGNTLDSCDFKKGGIWSELTTMSPELYYETLWGNPATTEEMIKAVAVAGFGAVRIPVTYYDHFDDQFQISEKWLRRVEEIVNYVLDNNMYCIINLHHDAGEDTWLKADPEHIEDYREELGVVWLQIAEHFQSYGRRLLFEGFNEILDKNKNWNKSSPAAYDVVNQLNQVFVDTVRSASGNNKDRFLIVNTYAAGVDEKTLDAFALPRDSIEGHLIVGVHNYVPQEFTMPQEKVPWAKAVSDWDNEKNGQSVERIFRLLNTYFVEKGIPLIVTEFAARNKSNTPDRAEYAASFVSAAKKYNIVGFWWDDGGKFESADEITTMTLLDRQTNEWFFPEIVHALIEAADSTAD